MNYFKIPCIVFGLAAMLKSSMFQRWIAGMLEKDNGKKNMIIDIRQVFSVYVLL